MNKVRRLYIALIVCCLGLPVEAKIAKKPIIPQEQEQQFLYYFYAARHAIESNNFPRAYTLLDFCQQINPKDAVTNDHLGVIYASLKQQDIAAQYFQRAYELAPAECNEHYLDYLMDTGQWKKALKVQDNVDALSGYTANSALNRYRIYLGLNKGKQAVDAIDQYLEQDPESLNFLLFRAEIHMQLGEEKQVFELSERIAKLFPLQGHEYAMIQKVPYCAYYISLIKTFEADSLVNIGQLNRGYENYEIAIYLWPKNMTALNNYAYCMAIYGGDLTRAEQMSAKTIQVDADNATFLDTYAWILHLKGQDALATFYLRKALEKAKDPDTRKVINEHLTAIEGEKK